MRQKLTPQDEINKIMTRYGLTVAWLAEQLGIYYQKADYLVNTKKTISQDEYDAVMDIFEKHGFLEPSGGLTGNIATLTIAANSILNSQLKKLNDCVTRAISDNKITYSERQLVDHQLNELRETINKEIDKLRDSLIVKDSSDEAKQ
jgi:hypothetical protein